MSMIYSILLCLISSYSIVHAAFVCNTVLPRGTRIIKCCESTKPLECVYKSPMEQTQDAKCDCAPKADTGSDYQVCRWKADSSETTDYGKRISCYGFFRTCVESLGPSPDCHGYPPHSSGMEVFPEHYCTFGTGITDVYNVLFTCWLYDCENRLKKSVKTLRGGGLVWCYPPTIKYPQAQFCPLYTLDTHFEFYDVREPVFQSCILPPLCEGFTERVDTDNYMPANFHRNGASNMTHCETLCNIKEDNNGTYTVFKRYSADDHKCRVIPSCPESNATADISKYNKFQVPTCLPWCTEEDSYVRSSYYFLRNNTYSEQTFYCNPLPICDEEGEAPKPLYGSRNPYAATRCVPRRNCTENEDSDKYYCDFVPYVKSTSTQPPEPWEPEPSHVGLYSLYAAIIGAANIGVVLVFVLCVALVILYLRTEAPELPPRPPPFTLCYPGCPRAHVMVEEES